MGKLFSYISLVAGERRYRAAQKVGLAEIPAILTKGNPLEIALIENLQRDDLKPIEEAEALGQMINEYNYLQDQLSQVIGKAKSTISETLSLNKLPEEIKAELRQSNNYSRRLLVEISKQETPEKMLVLFNTVKVDNLKSNELRNITRKKSEQTQRSYSDVMLAKIHSWQKQITKFSLQSLESEPRAQIMNELHILRRSLDEILD
jgi:ParB family chromosome partitioning protein